MAELKKEEPVIRWVCSDPDCKTGPRSKPISRMPIGWKRQDESLFCPACWRKRFVLRAVTIAVAAPEQGTWDELRQALRAMWISTTQASNWILTELYARDIRRGDEEKMPNMKPLYLYPELRARFPGLPSQTCAAIEKAVTAKYRAKRYEVIWTCGASLPTHRYPTPFPVPNQGWSVYMDRDQPVVSARIGDARVSLRLRGGPRYWRQLDAVRRIESGEAEQGQMDIYAQGKDIMCKMVAWIPRRTAVAAGPDTLLVRTGEESLIVALNAKDSVLWTYNGDQIKRWIAEHSKRLQRWSEDAKAEHRPDPPFAERRKFATERFHRRMANACHSIASMIVGYAVRRRFAAVRYDDQIRDFCPEFVWFALADKIIEKCDAAGLAFERVETKQEAEAPVAGT